MNSFVGIWSLGDDSVSDDALQRMANRLRPVSGAHSASHHGGTWGVTCQTLDVSGDSPSHRQPLCDPPRDSWIAFDGRIDNRADLLRELAPRERDGEITDAGLVLAAYGAWGDACVDRLIGDFAFVIVDHRARTVYCARDIIGVRPLFFAVTPRAFCFASELRPLLAALPDTPPLDQEYVADFVADDLVVTARTPYQGISRLLAAHTLSVRFGNVTTRRYWSLPAAPGHAEGNERDHQEKFLALLTEGVRCRLRAVGPVCAELSGGLDSNTIVSLSADMLGPRRAALCPVSVIYNEASHVNELPWTAFTLTKYALVPRYVDGDAHHPLKQMEEGAAFWDEPNCLIPSFALLRSIDDTVTAAGSQVLLSGLGAESVVMDPAAPPIHLADMLQSLELSRLWRELLRWQSARKVPLANLFVHNCLRPLFQSIVRGRRRLLARSMPPWIERTYAQRWDILGRARQSRSECQHRRPADRWQAEMFVSLAGALQPHAAHRPFEVRYPFLHRPLMEYVATLPWTERLDPSLSKPLLRRSLKSVLPEEIRTRTDKTSFDQSFFLSASKKRRQLDELLEAPLVTQLGIVNRDALAEALNLARCGHSRDTPRLLSCIALEAWLRWNYGRTRSDDHCPR
jgi:asparagine synthase (glutamine-hydrolysing)